MASQMLGGEPLIQRCPICSLFLLRPLMVLGTGGYAYGILK